MNSSRLHPIRWS